jgi:hypothetical protein
MKTKKESDTGTNDDAIFKDAIYTCEGQRSVTQLKGAAIAIGGLGGFIMAILLYGAGWAQAFENATLIAYGIYAPMFAGSVVLFAFGIKRDRKERGVCFALFNDRLTIRCNGELVDIPYDAITKYTFAGHIYNTKNGNMFAKHYNYGSFCVTTNNAKYKSSIRDIAAASGWLERFIQEPQNVRLVEEGLIKYERKA